MHIHMVIDDQNWAFGQIARGLGAACQRAGHPFTYALADAGVYGQQLRGGDAKVLVGFVGLLPHVADVPDERLYVGLMSHWELDTPAFRANLGRMRRAAAVYAGCGSIAEMAADLLDRPVYCLPGGIDVSRYKPTGGPHLGVGWSGNAGLDCKRFGMAQRVCERLGVQLNAVGRGGDLQPLTLDEMPKWFAGLEVYLCTSSEDTGPSGPLEAAACGVPTISTPCGFMPDFIRHNQTGWIANTEDQMYECLKLALEFPLDTRRMGENARRHVERHWSWDERAKPYLAMVEGGEVDSATLYEPRAERFRGDGVRDDRPLACIALMRTMDVEDAAVEAALWRLVSKSDRFRWTLAPSPPLASVDWARSKLLSDCLRRTDADVFIMQDGDMGVELADYEHLCERALAGNDGTGVIMGSMLCKRGGGGMCGTVDLARHFAEPGSLTVKMYSDQQAEIERGEYNGAALTAYPRAVLERLAAVLPWAVPHGTPTDNAEACEEHGYWPFFMPELRPVDLAWAPDKHGGTVVYMTEDRAFCDIARGVLPPVSEPEERRRDHPIEHIWISLKPCVSHWGSFKWLPHMAHAGRIK
jgi:hypothetical protein